MTDERYYSPQDVAKMWNMSADWARKRFAHEPGVMRLGYNWRIPESALRRVAQASQVPPEPVRLPKTRARRLPDGSVVLIPRVSNASR